MFIDLTLTVIDISFNFISVRELHCSLSPSLPPSLPQVDMSTHEGYTGGLSPSYTAGSCMTYYASSTEEILFHVSTRMPSTSGTDVSHKVKGEREEEREQIYLLSLLLSRV